MSSLSSMLDTPEKLFIAAGTAFLVFAIVAPTRIPWFGKIALSPGRQLVLGAIGCALLVAGAALTPLISNFLFSKVQPPASQPVAAGSVCDVLKSEGDQATTVNFVNTTSAPVKLYWIDQGCGLEYYYDVAAGTQVEQQTYAGHRWLITDDRKIPRAMFTATPERMSAVIQ